ncbi:phage portal protein [Salinicola endophyticus]|uniref:Phage portal protein n=1 Tax=Salinicola endophyticus TaxID=1949083 RepID=A0AB74U2D4_9GAMM
MGNPLDSVINALAPQWGARRAGARQILSAYEAAKPSRTQKAKGSTLSGDLTAQIGGRSLREQARWLDENHDLVTGIFDRLEERVVGADGMGIEPIPLDTNGQRLRELSKAIKAEWAAWSLRPETTGEMTRPEMERLVVRSWLRDGEVLAQELRGRVPLYDHLTDVPYALECLEADYLPLHFNDPAQKIAAGIERNAWRRVKAYHVYKQHPGSLTNFAMATKRVPADSMIHLAHRKRLQQSRGISILHAVLQRLADLKDYEESERVAARIAAAMTMYIKKGEPHDYAVNSGKTDQGAGAALPPGQRAFQIAPGMVFDGLMPGEDVGTIQSNRPSALLDGFRGAMIRAAAAGTRMGYSTANRDYNGTYSAQRQELIEAQLGYDLLQGQFRDQWSRRVYRSWLDMAVIIGRIQLPPNLDRRTLYNAFYLGPVMPWIDPGREADAWEQLVAAGFADESEVARARGRNPQELKQSREDEIAENREKGLVFSSDAYHEFYGGKNGADPNGNPAGNGDSARARNRQLRQPADGQGGNRD